MKVALLLTLLVAGAWAAGKGTRAQLDEDFGYVTVRPGAHMFWVTYHVDQPGEWTDYPLIMWLQGGPGSSGVGYGNFEELGPYYMNGTLREMAWTKRANVMFVDNPVGTGYSYVDSPAEYTTTNQEIADDLVALVKSVFTDYPDMAVMPFFVYAESYGGKMTVDFALALNAAINNGEVVCNFQGVALGDSWISPMDSVNTWGPYLYAMGMVNQQGQANIDESAAATQAAVDAGEWQLATDLWGQTEGVVIVNTNGVNFYNVLTKEDIYVKEKSKHRHDLSYMRPSVRALYEHHVMRQTRDALSDFMNGEMAVRWNIPAGVVWGGQGGQVFNTLEPDFMKPVVDSVVQLLEQTNIMVVVFSGDLDLICDTPGTYRWIENMQYTDKPQWDATRRVNIYVSEYSNQAGYVQRDDRFAVFTMLRSGHMVPTDVPEASLVMLDMITGYGAELNPQKIEDTDAGKEDTQVEETMEHKAAAGPVEETPAKKVKAAPVKVVEAAPAQKVDAATVKVVQATPALKVESAPAQVEAAPVQKVIAATVKVVEAAPAQKVIAAPVKVLEAAPAQKVIAAPVKVVEVAPVQKVIAATVKVVEAAPVQKVIAAPVKVVEVAPVQKVEAASVNEVDGTPVHAAVHPKLTAGHPRPLPPSAAARAAHVRNSLPHKGHVTPTGQRQGKREGIARKIPHRPQTHGL